MTTIISWNDGLGHRSLRPWLLLITEDERVLPFKGQDIERVAVVRGHDYQKNGKWSSTTYRIETARGVRAVSGRDGWETGRFVEGLCDAVRFGRPVDTWADVANALEISVPSAMTFLRSWRPKAAAALDEVDRKLDELDEAADEAEADRDNETVVVSFGSPTRRQCKEGFWTSPKGIQGHGGELRLLDPSRDWEKDNVTVVGMLGTVLAVSHASGHGGGYVSVTVSVVPGTETEVPAFESDRDRAARESGLPEGLFLAFDGDVERVRAFMGKVERLDVSRLDEHEMSCGRARKKAEVVRVSGDPDFFLGADPLGVCWYIEEAGTGGAVSPPAPKPEKEDAPSGSATLVDLMGKFNSHR